MLLMLYSCNILLENFHELAALTESDEEYWVLLSFILR
jgi:hypothetical protein